MSGRKRTVISPSLFPFLAVLVCTLGTLILLLALVAQDAVDAQASTAQASTTQASSTEDNELPSNSTRANAPRNDHPGFTKSMVSSMIEEHQFLVEQYVSFREEQTGEIEERRDKLAHVEAHIEKIRSEILNLNQEVETATTEKATSKVTATDLTRIKQVILEKEREVKTLRAEGHSATPRIVIVPHKGPNGTDRRPVYLECTSRGLLIWPEKSIIPTPMLERSTTGANPIESALRVIRYHVMTTYGDPAPPYPLLIIRPDGVETYLAARGAMTEYDDQFGYELVPDEVQLALSKPDRELKKKIERAIAEAIVKQAEHSVIAQRNNYRKQRRLPTLSAAAMDRQDRANGYSSHRGQKSMSPSRPRVESARDYARRERSNRSAATPPQENPHLARQSDAGTWNASSQSSIDPARMQRWNDDLQDAANELKGKGSSLDEASEQISSSALAHLSGSGAPHGEPRTPIGDETPSLHEPSMGPPLATGNQDDGTRKTNTLDSDNPPSEGTPSTLASSTSRSSKSSSTSNSSPTPSTQACSTQACSTRGNSNQPNSAQENSGQSNGAPQPNATPPVNLDPSAKRWVLPPNVSLGTGNALVRKMRADCYTDGFVLQASRETTSLQSFVIDPARPTQAMMGLATAIHHRIARWGVAIPGGYWSPRLEVTVHPGGDSAFEQLQHWMHRSGVEVTRAPSNRPNSRPRPTSQPVR